MLSPAQIQQRDGRLTASRVACLMTGNEEKIMDLWRELTGDPSFVPDDLSDVWPVQLGAHTESLNLDWYERRTGRPVTKRGDVIIHPGTEWAAATLDGWDALLPAVIECKHVGGFEKTSTIIERYFPQVHWQMIVTGTDLCIMSIIEGAREPVLEEVRKDKDYAAELWARAESFMQCVFELRPPVMLPPIEPPVTPEKSYDMTGKNEWASEAVTWITTRQSAKDFSAAEKTIKKLVPADAIVCRGHGIEVRRNKAGSLAIKEIAE